MTAAILTARKLKAGDSAEAIGRELDRRAHAYANEVDLDRSKSNLNWVGGRWVTVDVARPVPLELAIEARMAQLHTKRKIRKDAVRAEGFVISTNNKFSDTTEAVEWLKEAVGWMADRYGRENLLAASIHMDETTLHAHAWIAPVIHDDATGLDRLCAKELFCPDKLSNDRKSVLEQGTLSKLQEDFYKEVAAKAGFDEPLTHSKRLEVGREYKSLGHYKAVAAQRDAEQKTEALNSAHAKLAPKVQKLVRANELLTPEIERKRAEAARLGSEIEESEIDAAMAHADARDAEHDRREALGRLESVQGRLTRVEESRARVAARVDDLEELVRATRAVGSDGAGDARPVEGGGWGAAAGRLSRAYAELAGRIEVKVRELTQVVEALNDKVRLLADRVLARQRRERDAMGWGGYERQAVTAADFAEVKTREAMPAEPRARGLSR